MDGGRKFERQAWKFRVRQEFDVYLYFHEGILAEDDEEVHSIIVDEALNAAFGDDGLTVVTHEETDSSNGYLAYVTTYEPTASVTYNYKDMPQIIKMAIDEKGLIKRD